MFGAIANGKMVLNDGGKIAQLCCLDIPNHFPHAKLDAFVVMPDHVHGIIILHEIYFSVMQPTMAIPLAQGGLKITIEHIFLVYYKPKSKIILAHYSYQ